MRLWPRDVAEAVQRDVDAAWELAWRYAALRRELVRARTRAQMSSEELQVRFAPQRPRLLARLGPEVEALELNLRRRQVDRRRAAVDLSLVVAIVAVRSVDVPWTSVESSQLVGLILGLGAGVLCGDGSLRLLRIVRLRREHHNLVALFLAKLDALLVPQLRRMLNQLLRVPFASLAVTEVVGLSEVVDPSLEVPTRARGRLVELLGSMSSGSIGISGSRGAGKSTLIRAACAGRLGARSARAPIGVWVSAPVRWEASEFIPYLFGELCTAVAPWLRDADQDGPYRRRGALIGLVGSALALLTSLLLLIRAMVGLDPFAEIAQRFEVILLALVTGALLLVVGRRLRRYAGIADPLSHLAERRLRELRYRETVVQGWSLGAAPSLVGLSLGRRREATTTEQPMTLPEVIGRYKGFVERVARDRPVVIGIDELDKMDSAEDAARFLRDIKVLFGQRRCFYLVSVSDDAMSEFERRGMPVRNVFDSSFDDVLHVDPLSYGEAHAIVNGRVVGMGDAHVALCYVMSGGLPRELIRSARAVIDVGARGETSPVEVAWEVIGERMGRTVRAVEMIAARHVGADGRHPLLDWLAALPSMERGTSLQLRWDVGSAYASLARHPLAPADLDAQRLMLLELAVAAYRAATILELWDGFTQEALDAATRTVGRSPALVLLARAWQDLSLGPAAAWRTVDLARQEIGLPMHPFPIDPAVGDRELPVRTRDAGEEALGSLGHEGPHATVTS